MTPPNVSVVVLFPDDFRPDLVFSALATLRSKRPETLPVIVTKEPKRFESLSSPENCIVPLVIPRPVWGWTILDAIRAKFDSESPGVET